MDKQIVHIFNEMEDEYDEIEDLWYSWIFSRLHFLIAKKIVSKWTSPKKVLDIGCGTGFQSFLYAKVGAEVTGIDISDRLIAVAEKKLKHFNPKKFLTFFEPKFKFVERYDALINKYLDKVAPEKFVAPVFAIGDAQCIDAPDEYFDHINCCGSTFSFVPDYAKAISEIHRTLKKGGTFVLEVESKNNMDLYWPILDSSIFFGKLEYETSFKEAITQSFGNVGQHIQVEYPFGDVKNPVYMNIRLFKKRKLIQELRASGLKVTKSYSIHSVTNLLPSTLLDSGNPGFFTRTYFRFLRKIEQIIPFNLPGCSLVLMGEKVT